MIDISLSKIQIARDAAGNILNPRGDRFTSTDLQDSFSISGQKKEVEVAELADGTYLLLDGHRRVQAAEALGWKTIRAIVKELPTFTDTEILIHMLASDMQQPFKPTALGQAFKRLMLDKKWGIERIAKLRGIAVEKARLYLDLLEAPESLRERVDAGEMSLSAFALLRNQPEDVQERAAALPKPTKSAVQSTIRKATGRAAADGMMTDLFKQMEAEEHHLVKALRALYSTIRSDWYAMSQTEQDAVTVLNDALHLFIENQSVQEELADVAD